MRQDGEILRGLPPRLPRLLPLRLLPSRPTAPQRCRGSLPRARLTLTAGLWGRKPELSAFADLLRMLSSPAFQADVPHLILQLAAEHVEVGRSGVRGREAGAGAQVDAAGTQEEGGGELRTQRQATRRQLQDDPAGSDETH
eukprot:768265-Hanusia_phi.AAC.1